MLRWPLVLILTTLGFSACNRFQYIKRSSYRRTINCNLCYNDDCLVLDQDRCDYYEQASLMLQDEEQVSQLMNSTSLKAELDGLFFDMADKALETEDLDCIPYISRYTNCYKENVCLGCKTCSCSDEGKWNCSTAHNCQVNPIKKINRKILTRILDVFLQENEHDQNDETTAAKKVKRSIFKKPNEEFIFDDTESITKRIIDKYQDSDDEIDKILFKKKASVKTTIPAKMVTNPPNIPTQYRNTANSISDIDSLGFDEVLQNIAVETKFDTQRKPKLKTDSNKAWFELDYMLLDDDDQYPTTNSKTYATSIKDDKNYETPATNSKTYASSIKDDKTNETPATNSKTYSTSITDENNYKTPATNSKTYSTSITDENNYKTPATNSKTYASSINDEKNYETPATNLKTYATSIKDIKPTLIYETYTKRYEKTVIEPTTKAIKAPDSENTTAKKEFGFDVLKNEIEYNVINNNIVKREIPTANVIKENVSSTESDPYNVKDIDENLNKTNPNETIVLPLNKILDNLKNENVKNSKEHLLNKTTTMHSPNEFSLLQLNDTGYQMLLKKYTVNLKKDIIKVLMDTVHIQKLKNVKLPNDLSLLIQAMKLYIYKSILLENENYPLTRKSNNEAACCYSMSFKDCAVLILQAINKDVLKLNGLGHAQKVVNNLIRNRYNEQDFSIRVKAADPINNLTSYLSFLNTKWQTIAVDIKSSSPSVLYKIKLFHLILTSALDKLQNLLKLTNFYQNRRMNPNMIGKYNTIEKLNSVFRSIHDKLIHLKAQIDPAHDHQEDEINLKNNVKHKKLHHSFIKRIRSLLKRSRKELNAIIHGKIPKQEIAKDIVRDKLDLAARNKYDNDKEVMGKWQKNLAIIPRRKRSVLKKLKNIIPYYLRRKVNRNITSKVKPKVAKKKRSDKKKETR